MKEAKYVEKNPKKSIPQKKQKNEIAFHEAYKYINPTDYINNIANVNLIIKEQIIALKEKSNIGPLSDKDIKLLTNLQKCTMANANIISSSKEAYMFAKQELYNAIVEYKQEFPIQTEDGKILDNFVSWLDGRELTKQKSKKYKNKKS